MAAPYPHPHVRRRAGCVGLTPGGLTAEELKPVLDLVSQIAAPRASGDSWHSLDHLLLLNLLLPALIATLGHVFERRSEGD